MKTLISISILLFVLCQKLYAQPNSVFPIDGTAYWEIDYNCYDPDPWYYTGTIEITGDTIINNAHCSILAENTFIKVVGDKVFTLDTDTSFSVAFDFGLNVGDVFHYPYPSYSYNPVTVIAVDTVQYLDSIPRRRIMFNEPYTNICGQADTWVEGIGGLPNPIYFWNCFECEVWNFRFYQNDQLIYENKTINTEETNNQSEVSIYPNPAKDFFTIKNSGINNIEEVRLIDVRGKVLIQQNLSPIETNIMLPPDLPQGLYFLLLKSNKNGIQVKKILIE